MWYDDNRWPIWARPKESWHCLSVSLTTSVRPMAMGSAGTSLGSMGPPAPWNQPDDWTWKRLRGGSWLR
ncbi:hypothetical protein BGZ61DRAFT_442235 [Ilyonectria robusta]|uniref:uncharacterized protein n=1 Tax=Ilyonectria robusta TaxID=1079257 RepID=UPI001E8DCBAB|nr:uncharacterized protein BGZ61DRAFT_442235 [Ilyonectria robusta]KAH8736605.1 hypothetical protein BGZ61DRAFT_442235 [Ilyonectria robusta]